MIILWVFVAVCIVMLYFAARADIKNQEKINAESEILDKQIADFAKRCCVVNKESEFQALIDEGIRFLDKKMIEKQLINIMFYCGIVRGKIMASKYKKD